MPNVDLGQKKSWLLSAPSLHPCKGRLKIKVYQQKCDNIDYQLATLLPSRPAESVTMTSSTNSQHCCLRPVIERTPDMDEPRSGAELAIVCTVYRFATLLSSLYDRTNVVRGPRSEEELAVVCTVLSIHTRSVAAILS